MKRETEVIYERYRERLIHEDGFYFVEQVYLSNGVKLWRRVSDGFSIAQVLGGMVYNLLAESKKGEPSR